MFFVLPMRFYLNVSFLRDFYSFLVKDKKRIYL